MAGGTSTSGNGSQRNSSTTGAADNGGRHVSLHAVQFKFGKLFSVLVAFRSNRFLEQAAAASDAENVTSSQRLLLPSVLALCIGTEEEHRAVTASSAGGARRFCVESRFEVFKKMSVEAEKALGHWRTVFIGSGVQLAEQAALTKVLLWLVGYHNIFSAPCQACGRLMNVAPASTSAGNVMMLPTRRDLETGDAFHETCTAVL
eukprot:INCI5262.1.p2 GENE.INCI5262.1~~INCI5262.1.p2  ORF type:complete len:203 (-),score=52.57 INCI5262.1:115-723(-)